MAYPPGYVELATGRIVAGLEIGDGPACTDPSKAGPKMAALLDRAIKIWTRMGTDAAKLHFQGVKLGYPPGVRRDDGRNRTLVVKIVMEGCQ